METTRYDNGKQAIAEYHNVDELKDFRDKARAVEEYARQANDYELQRQSGVARCRAERRCGQLLKEMKAEGTRATGKEAGPGRGREKVCPSGTPFTTLSEMGITRKQSSNWQKLAEVPEERFDYLLDICGPAPSTSHIVDDTPKFPQEWHDPDSLAIWGLVGDMKREVLLERPLAELVGLWTGNMREQHVDALMEFEEWVGKGSGVGPGQS